MAVLRNVSVNTGYVVSYGLSSAVALFPMALHLMAGIVNRSGLRAIVALVLIFITLGLLNGVRKKKQSAFWVSLALSTILWLMLAVRTAHRINFILENDGMERADGYGSPMAFLIGIVGEQLFFIPLCFVVVTGWLSVVSRGKTYEGSRQ